MLKGVKSYMAIFETRIKQAIEKALKDEHIDGGYENGRLIITDYNDIDRPQDYEIIIKKL